MGRRLVVRMRSWEHHEAVYFDFYFHSHRVHPAHFQRLHDGVQDRNTITSQMGDSVWELEQEPTTRPLPLVRGDTGAEKHDGPVWLSSTVHAIVYPAYQSSYLSQTGLGPVTSSHIDTCSFRKSQIPKFPIPQPPVVSHRSSLAKTFTI